MADAVDRRRLLVATQTALAGCSALLCAISLMPAPSVVLLYVVAFLSAGIGAVDQPARSSAIPRLVPRERLTAAIALNQLGFQASSVIGPALGGLILVTIGIAAGYLVDVLTFGAAITALLLIHPIPPTPGAARPSRATILEGLHFVRRRRAILGSLVVDLNAMIFGMPTALFPVMALDVFKVGPVGLGLMNAAPAFGRARRRGPHGLDDPGTAGGLGRHLGRGALGCCDHRLRASRRSASRSRCSAWRSPAEPT